MQGGNFIDTADIYSGGESERLVGRFIADSGARDDIVLATKFAFNGSASPLTADAGRRRQSQCGRCRRQEHTPRLDASLRRLGTDYIDLYWMHIWDGVTPVEEIVQTFGDLVRAGKIRYYGLSDMPAWLAMKAPPSRPSGACPARSPCSSNIRSSRAMSRASMSRPRGKRAWASCRGAPWREDSCPASMIDDDTSDTGRLSGANPFGNSKFVDRNWDILDALKAVAADLGRSPAQVALAWTLARPGVASTLIGASKLSQLDDNILGADLRLGDAQMKSLDEAGAPALGFSASLAQPFIRRMIFGGHDVAGWDDQRR